ncbi:MAG: ABC-F family ATP-binding cassette domain-containing protein [Acidobacteria bacterium]|nr:ABC-F family ATP-binding cassette domain-containing protein [Acidobacteriota bacterium]MBI3656357.1 ABC-F family ATP-binding cassette domain-containing protein [Acidobacteriota bacterium]
MMQLIDISHNFGPRELFHHLNWHIRKQDRIALIGANGMGKTTLFRIITGEVMPERGEVLRPNDLSIGYLPQDGLAVYGRRLFEEALSAFDEVLTIKRRIEDIAHQLSEAQPLAQVSADQTEAGGQIPAIQSDGDDRSAAEHKALLERYGALQHEFEDRGGFTMEAETAKVLHGLGFTDADFDKLTEAFSGGWQMRILLAKLLLQRPKLLLLDEPTNHLDLDSIQWLEEYLSDYQGSVVVISHDRYFIDRLCRRMVELEHKQLYDYYGGYEDFLEQKAMRQKLLLSAYEQQQSEIRRIELFVERFRFKATKARQVQSHLKMLDRMEKIGLPEADQKVVKFRFPQPTRSGHVVLTLDNISKCYDGRPVFDDLSYTLYRGDKAALVGINGAGKSTLSRIIAGTEPPSSGGLTLGYNVRLEYFAQQQAEKLNTENTVYEELVCSSEGQTMVMLRTILGAFLFSGDDVFKKVAVLSGGEKARLALAKMLLGPANFLVMDEPTNHIDIQTKDILKAGLSEYEGSFLIASHDRYFLDGLVNKVLELKDGQLTEYLGSFSDYLEKKKQERSLADRPVERPMDETPANDSGQALATVDEMLGRKTREQRRREADERRRTSTERAEKKQRIAAIENEIARGEARKAELDTLLADPVLYQDGERSKALVLEYRTLSETIPHLYEEWEALAKEA